MLSSISNGEPIDYDNVKRLFEKAENNIQVNDIACSVQHSKYSWTDKRFL